MVFFLVWFRSLSLSFFVGFSFAESLLSTRKSHSSSEIRVVLFLGAMKTLCRPECAPQYVNHLDQKRERPPCLVTCHVAREAVFCRFMARNSLHRLTCRFLIQNSVYNIAISDDSRTVVADMLSFTFSLFPPFLSFLRFFACLHY